MFLQCLSAIYRRLVSVISPCQCQAVRTVRILQDPVWRRCKTLASTCLCVVASFPWGIVALVGFGTLKMTPEYKIECKISLCHQELLGSALQGVYVCLGFLSQSCNLWRPAWPTRYSFVLTVSSQKLEKKRPSRSSPQGSCGIQCLLARPVWRPPGSKPTILFSILL